MKDILKSLFVIGSLALSFNSGSAQISPANLPDALANAKAGEVIIVKDGVYPNQNLSLSGEGTATAPVVIRPETPGRVIFTGQSALRLRGNYVTLAGFHFKNGFSPEKYVIEMDGKHCRLTGTVVESFNPPDPDREDKWVSLKGQHHRVDACSFMNKTSKSVTLVVWRQKGVEDHHVISGNLFSGRPKGAESNGYETIRIGSSEESESDSKTTVEKNLFEACDGEIECISVKAGANTIRNNTLLECAGTITLRHGHGSLVEGNLIAGKMKKETGGIRVYDSNHVIRGNAIIGTTGRSGGAITLMSGTPAPDLNGYHRADSVAIEKNLIAANKGPAIKFDGELGKDGRTEAPTAISALGNFLSGDQAKGLLEGAEKLAPGALIWNGSNQLFMNNQIPKDVTRTIPPPLNRSMVGATWFRDQN